MTMLQTKICFFFFSANFTCGILPFELAPTMRVATRSISVRRNKITSHRTLILFEVAKLSVNDWLNKTDK